MKSLTPALRRALGGLLLLGVVIVPPVLLSRLVFGSDVVTVGLFAALVGTLNTLMGSVRLGLIATGIFVLLAPVSIAVGAQPVAGAALMAAVCLVVGQSATFKRYGGFYEIPLGMAFLMTTAPQDTDQRQLLTVMAVAAFCGAWATFGVKVVGKDHDIPFSERHSKADTLEYTLTMAVLVSGSTYYVLTYSRNGHGIWLVLTLFMILQVGPQATKQRTLQRVAGTVAGSLVAAVLVTVVTNRWVIIALLCLALLGMFATLGQQPYAVFAFFLTTAILLGVAAPADAVQTSVERVGYTVLGALLALIALGIASQVRSHAKVG